MHDAVRKELNLEVYPPHREMADHKCTELTSKMRAGLASRAMAVDNFLRLPPEYVLTGLSAYSFSPNLVRAHSTTFLTSGPGSPRNLE